MFVISVILIVLCTNPWNYVNGNEHGRYTRCINEYEIIIPTKVSQEGKFVSYYLPHFYNAGRVQRGVDLGIVNYIIPLGGKENVLELQPAEDFYAPGMVIEHHEFDARNDLNNVKLRRPRPRRCFYHGWIRDQPQSSAAISACTGLAGFIKIGADQYLIEPVKVDENPTVDIKHKHLLYKRSTQKFTNQSCGTIGNFKAALKERMEWEDKYGRKLEEEIKVAVNPFSAESGRHTNLRRHQRWCTTCRPNQILKCLTPQSHCVVNRPLFIELLVVIGPRVADMRFLDDDLEQYVNTIINIVVKHFQDSSLGRPILIKLVRVITLGFKYEELDAKRYSPQELLRNFCEWQMHFNPKMEDHPNHHDFAIYLVKFEQCQGSMLGITNMASMCRPDRACAVVGEEGLLTGNVITHMLGHSLGAEHDDSSTSSCCPEEPDGTKYHMGPNICSRSSAWSVCSKQCILQFVKTHAGWCLTDIPTSVDLTEPTLLPGQVYSAAEQCRINFEIETYACLVGEFCKRLYCKINDRECLSTGDPPAQGTRCGPDMWCFNKRCVHRGSRPGATNGEWGMWSHWSPCTKTCGGGIQSSYRACDSPIPSQGGKICPGPWIKSRMCNVGGCPDAGKGFLDQQCKITNVKPYHGRKHEWMHYNQQIEDLQCVVVCINERNEIAVRSPLAVDGTFCKPGTKNVCIRGACTQVGCDWVIGSTAKEDSCGICHGNGTECRIMQGYFGEQNFQGVIEFLKLPIGTSMILIRETRPSPCFFVIANSLNSSYYLNSDREEQLFFTGTFNIRETVGVYQLKADMERLFIKKPISVPITISMVCHEMESIMGVLYQYALPEPNNPAAIPSYTWEFLSWEKCPFPCGGGAQRAIPLCVESQGGEVEDCYCSAQVRPPDKVRVCNAHPCDARWWVGPWANCECFHQEGITTRMVMCAHLKETRSSHITIVKQEECMRDPKPRSEKACDSSKEGDKKTNSKFIKRDLMDIIPYNEAAENYTIWDDLTEDKYPFMVNMKTMFRDLNPESVNDFVFLKDIGITTDVWKRIQEENEKSPHRRRRRQKLISPTKQVTKPNEKITESKLKIKLGKTEKVNKLKTNILSAVVDKKKIVSKTKPYERHPPKGSSNVRKLVETESMSTSPKPTRKPITQTQMSTEVTHHTKIETLSTCNQITTVRPTVLSGEHVNILGPKNIGQQYETTTRHSEITTTRAAHTETSVSDNQIARNQPQKVCPQEDVTKPKTKPTCGPRQTVDSAPDAAEMDFMNASNVKIFIVPIRTTIRTIIQNDQEFVLMETMAKYPIGDELNVAEHYGDAARRELKLARDRQSQSTIQPPLYD